MLENYIDQIITMGTLADSVTIIDDQQIIRHFQPFNPDIVPFTASDVVGTHFPFNVSGCGSCGQRSAEGSPWRIYYQQGIYPPAVQWSAIQRH